MSEKWKRSRETLMVREDAEWIVSKIRRIIRMMGLDPNSGDERLLKTLTGDIEGRLHDYYEEGYNDGRGDSGRGDEEGGDECPTRSSTSSRVGPHGKCCECPWPEGGGDDAE